nr:proteasome subunit beta type-5-like [Tanacetum cinerariifolium]
KFKHNKPLCRPLGISLLHQTYVTSNFDEYEKKSTQMVQLAKGTTSVAFIFEGDVMVIDDSRASMGSYIYVPVCSDSVQQECYRPLDMAASMDTHADVTDSEQSENSSSRNFSMTYDHTPPSIAVPQTFSSHKDRQIKSMAEGGRSHLWRELRNRVVTYGSSAIACARDVFPNRVARSRLGLLRLRNRVIKEGDASSLLVTSSSNVIVASDDGISQEDPTHYANAVSSVPDPVCLGLPPCFTQNQVSGTCETASYNANYQGRASHGSFLSANVHGSFPSRNVNRCVVCCTGVPGSNICPHSQNTGIDISERVLHIKVPRIIGASSSIVSN